VSNYRCSLLVVDDEPHILATLQATLDGEFTVYTADCAAAAQSVFASHEIDIVLTDQKMPRVSGVQLLEWVRLHSPRTVRLMMTGFADLEETVDAINKGQVFRFILKPWRHDVLLDMLNSGARSFQLERSNEQLLEDLKRVNELLEKRVAERTAELQEVNAELEQKTKMLERLALTDPLTNLPNRRYMDRLAERELRRRERYPGALSVGMIDVDHFKSINERYLLPGGDKVLYELARVLNASLREVDMLGRIGGEEFLVIAPQTSMEGAMILGERIRSTVEQAAFSYKDESIPVRVSIGFAVVEEGVAVDYETLKHEAASALAEAKKTGRNRCVFRSVGKLTFEHAG
jgi:diguanylate cyclase (GGDEF)-like protein